HHPNPSTPHKPHTTPISSPHHQTPTMSLQSSQQPTQPPTTHTKPTDRPPPHHQEQKAHHRPHRRTPRHEPQTGIEGAGGHRGQAGKHDLSPTQQRKTPDQRNKR